MDFLHQTLLVLTEAAILMFEFVGVIVLVVAGVRGIYDYVRGNTRTRLNLSKGMAMALEFKLGGEILRTVIVHDFQEILIIGGIIVLRASLAFMIYWSIKNEAD